MNHDGSANNGDDDETPEEMVNRSLAQAYDNQQRYMELFQHSAHMMQVLSRFMADPIVVHDLEEDASDTDSSSTHSNSTVSPTSCPVHAAVVSPINPSHNADGAQGVLCEIVQARLNAVGGFNHRRRPQSCRVRPREQPTNNRIGWSSDSDSHAAQRRPGVTQTRPELRLQRVLHRGLSSESPAVDDFGRLQSFSSPCSPLSTTCHGSTSSSVRQESDTAESTANETMSNKPKGNNDKGTGNPSVQNEGGGDCNENPSTSQPSTVNEASKDIETTTHHEHGDSSTKSAQNTSTNGVMSEERSHRFSIGVATQTSIRNAMSEISKAADTIRQARSMLNSLNLAPGVQTNNNNHESPEPAAESESNDEGNNENCLEYSGGSRNVLKFVQPIDQTFGAYDSLSGSSNDLILPTGDHGSLRPILVKPASENTISLIENAASEFKVDSVHSNIVEIPGENSQGTSSEEARQQKPRTVKFVIKDDKGGANFPGITQHPSVKAMTPEQFRSMINNRTMVMCGIGPNLPNTASVPLTDMEGRARPLRMTPYQPGPTEVRRQIERNNFEQSHIRIPHGLRRKLSPNSFNCSVRISVDTFQQALTQAIQTLEKEGSWLREDKNSEENTDSKVDNNHFALQRSSLWSRNQEVSKSPEGFVTSPERLENKLQLVQHCDPTDINFQNENRKEEETTEVIKYESSKHSLISNPEFETNGENTGQQPEPVQENSITSTSVKPFTDSEDGENDQEVQSIVNKNDDLDQPKDVRDFTYDIDKAKDGDGLEMIFLNEPVSPKETNSASNYSTSESESTKWKGCWVIKVDKEKCSTPKTPPITPILRSPGSKSPIAWAENDAYSHFIVDRPQIKAKVECHDQDKDQDKRQETDPKNEKGETPSKEKSNVFKRFSDKVKGWFKRNP